MLADCDWFDCTTHVLEKLLYWITVNIIETFYVLASEKIVHSRKRQPPSDVTNFLHRVWCCLIRCYRQTCDPSFLGEFLRLRRCIIHYNGKVWMEVCNFELDFILKRLILSVFFFFFFFFTAFQIDKNRNIWSSKKLGI